MKVIPRTAWALAVLLTLGVACAMLVYQIAFYRGEFPLAFLSVWQFILFSIVLATFFVYILVLGYIAGDARRRGMRAVLWVLLAMFMPSAIGILLYFILREPLLRACPKCGAGTKATFPYCPSCGTTLASVCPSCRNAVEPGWSHCARCGAQLLIA
jgi:hypothetical protein